MVLDSDDDSDNDDQQQQVVDEQQQEIQRLQGVADIICTDGKFADLGDLSPNRFEVVAGAGKKINITGRPGDGCLPYEQHQRSLEHETFVGIRLGEAIKPSFDSIVLDDFIEWARGLFPDVEKPLMHRCRDVLDRLHRLASR